VIRPADPADTPDLLALTAATGFFKPMEVATLEEVLADYFLMNEAAGDRCFVLEEDGVRLGFVYHAAEPMTENTWSLWWIVVRPATQGKGVGSTLLRFVEDDVRAKGARVLFIETSGLPKYESTCRFYRKHGYEQEARLRDYYAAGDDMLVFRKAL
jgi:ribosomal protein S18 acetylase RimI-like enzyme